MANPIIIQIKMPSGTVYDIVDQGARDLIQEILNFTEYLGVTTSPITEGSTINPILIDGEEVTAVAGNVVTLSSDSSEWIFSSTGKWQNFGKLSGLGALAFKDSASGSYTPAGTVSQPEFTGTSFTPAGSISTPEFSGSELTSTGSYTPAGSISNVVLESKTIKQFKTQGQLTSFAVSNGVLEITDGVLPTGEDVNVGSGSVTTQPTFTGTAATLSVKGTPAGTISTPEFSGTAVTPQGSVSQPAFSGTTATITVS